MRVVLRRSLLAIVLVAWFAPAQSEAAGVGVQLLGRSQQGRPIVVWERGDPRASRRVLVVGCIHGNECAGEAIVAWLEHAAVGPHTDLRLVPNLNPDGAAAGTRGDSRGVDLNRNFPWHWQRLGGLFDSGPRPLSERESRIAYRLILEYRPTVTIWFHQHEHLVDESGGSVGIEAHFARLAHLPLRQLPRYPGSVVGWENHVLSKGTAFVVELPRGSLTPSAARRFGQAVVALTNP